MAESTIGLYKSELVWPQGPWRNVEQLELATLVYVEWFNHRRLHGELDEWTTARHYLSEASMAKLNPERETPSRSAGELING